MNSIAFLWVGEDTEIPCRLVESIQLIMGNTVEIVQLTDEKTPQVIGVTSVQRLELSPYIMVARLQAYSQYKASTDVTFFCDADSLFIKPLELSFAASAILLSKRNIAIGNVDGLINDRYPEFYPEFTGKRFGEVMPFLFGAIAVRGDQSTFFSSLLKVCLELPLRFHRWYGDQYALASMVTNNLFDYGNLDLEKHLVIVKSEMSSGQLSLLRNAGVQMITFKGAESKTYMAGTLSELHELISTRI